MDNYWNYRVVKKNWKNGLVSYDVCEVYYENDKPTSWIWGKNVLSGESKVGLELTLDSVQKAFTKPVLEIIGDDEELVEIEE
ncbi:hypothetical protein HZF08_36355 [Paenibacillus sp. CGMCC 1.16610]|uniref:Transcriptional coactivator p15 (PC4) C-terminal domain-containing protein n=1 Tax=Paenibacillus anseongense TaxID=2682845 RepID=A0ABW9UCJ6_9BACL|nr:MULTISPECIES: hypothetical protein [Paenibacillus]MBA2943749.1 hypothetical protein [Paenibacillus sp. CGMCC 1.16610]MVQ37638.1 hypothetical protein [Paenibacillus anseongense]